MKTFSKSVLPLAIAMALATSANAGKIISGTNGFGGWNLDNVNVRIVDELGDTDATGSFDPADGSYVLGTAGSVAFRSDIYDASFDPAAPANVMAYVLGKDWPVGEPPGIKITHDDTKVKAPKPQNCILTTSYLDPDFLDTANPVPTTCSSPFQSHKRFKVAMLPATVDGVGNEGIDLVFNVEAEDGVRHYQVFQKINNWTDSRLQGFTVEVGFGVGAAFQKVSDAAVTTTAADLSISVPDMLDGETLWASDQLATFSHGLFGKADSNFPTDGFFGKDTAGFKINEFPNLPGVSDMLTADTTLAEDAAANSKPYTYTYADLPTGAAVANQFGKWLPNIWLPDGIFFDDDNNPDTDAMLMAWYGYNPDTQKYEWMYGSNRDQTTTTDDFNTVTEADLTTWLNDPLYAIGKIDDLVNIGLNYIVSVGDVANFPATANNTFTIRFTPKKDTSGQAKPGFVDELPPQTSSGVLTVSNSITTGDTVSISLTDKDLTGTVNVTVVNQQTNESETVTLTETAAATGVFTGTLVTVTSVTPGIDDDGTMQVNGGAKLLTTYEDASNVLGDPATVTTTTDVIAKSGSGGGLGLGLLGFLFGLLGLSVFKPAVRKRI